MTDLETTVLQAATGERRLDPDQQRNYFGTFAERVVLVVLLEDSQTNAVKLNFESILQELSTKYTTLSLKISPNLSDSDQMFYFKIAQNIGLSATIVNESYAHSPYGLVVHSDKAENVSEPDFSTYMHNLHNSTDNDTDKKLTKSFWSRLFNR